MEDGDPDTNYAYYALHKFNWTPSFFANLPLKEKIVIKVFIDEKIRIDKKAKKDAERKRSSGSSRRRR